MQKNSSFGNPKIAEKMAAQFGSAQASVKADEKYTKKITEFLLQIEKAHQQAAKSKLTFR